MVLFPNCKINLGLNILHKRRDGFHDIETVFFPIQLKEAIEVIERESFNFSTSGLSIEGAQGKNLCVKAYHLLKKDFPQLPTVDMYLHKTIPMGAGLGGGSADGAFTLKLLDKKFELSLTEKQLIDYAIQLGSDCPFFIVNKPCSAEGRGEILEQIDIDLSAYKIVIIHPGIHISTAWAFSQLSGFRQRREPDKYKTIKEIIQQPVSTWKQELKNDFEEVVFIQYPELKNIKTELYHAGAIYASMSGSGSALYGIFKKDDQINLPVSKTLFIKEISV